MDGSRPDERLVEPVEPAVVGHPLAVEQPADEPGRFVEPVEPFADPGPELDPEGEMLALEPARPEAEDGPAVGQLVEGRCELRGHARVAQGVRADEEAEADPFGQRCERPEGRP